MKSEYPMQTSFHLHNLFFFSYINIKISFSSILDMTNKNCVEITKIFHNSIHKLARRDNAISIIFKSRQNISQVK